MPDWVPPPADEFSRNAPPPNDAPRAHTEGEEPRRVDIETMADAKHRVDKETMADAKHRVDKEAMADAPNRADTEAMTDAPHTFAADPKSEMASRFNFFVRGFAKRFFSHFDLDDRTVERLRDLETRGSVIYVMRYSSRLDYFLFNTLFQKEGLRLSRFANGLRFYYYRPFFEALRVALFRPRGRPREIQHSEDQKYARELARAGESFFLFLRTARLRNLLRGRRSKKRQDELDLLEVVTRSVWEGDRQVFLVPLSVFWRKGPRSESRFLNLSYGSITRPSDLAKVTSFLATYRMLSVKCGEAIDLRSFIDDQRNEGEARVARKVRRSILAYLYREEKVVEGPSLRSPHRVQEAVLTGPRISAAVRERAAGPRGTMDRAWADAEKMFDEISARMNSTFLAVLAFLVSTIVKRMFAGIDVRGLEHVAENAKRHPLVIVPTHRSYFDFLIVSWLFYQNFLVPPHIAARENMGFGPFGFIFRRAGAFFLRKSFDDPLYKEVFRAYVSYLVREGFTQEFFIEGGRSRTGKTLAPRLGILSWNVEAFLDSNQRDLFFVPVTITYERLVEESSMIDELEGGEKAQESVRGLVGARKYLQRRFGSVDVSFGAPVSLAAALGENRVRFANSGEDGPVAAEKREFVEHLGLRITERINWGVVANATSVGAAVLMGTPHRGLRRETLAAGMQQIVDLLRVQGVALTQALEADQGEFREALAFLLRSDLVRSVQEGGEELLYFEESRRRALDLYRNAIGQFLATPSVLARRLLAGATRKELLEDLLSWHEVLYQEFFVPRDQLESAVERFFDHFSSRSWIDVAEEFATATPRGEPVLRFLAEQTRGVIEAYHAACGVAAEAIDAPESSLDRKAFMALSKSRFDHAVLLGEAHRTECANDTSFGNALDLMIRRGIVSLRAPEAFAGKSGKSPKGREPLIAPGENADALNELRDRLAAALAPR